MYSISICCVMLEANIICFMIEWSLLCAIVMQTRWIYCWHAREFYYIFHKGVYKLFYIPDHVGNMLVVCWIPILTLCCIVGFSMTDCWQIIVSMLAKYCHNVGDKLTPYCQFIGFLQRAWVHRNFPWGQSNARIWLFGCIAHDWQHWKIL